MDTLTSVVEKIGTVSWVLFLAAAALSFAAGMWRRRRNRQIREEIERTQREVERVREQADVNLRKLRALTRLAEQARLRGKAQTPEKEYVEIRVGGEVVLSGEVEIRVVRPDGTVEIQLGDEVRLEEIPHREHHRRVSFPDRVIEYLGNTDINEPLAEAASARS